MRSAILALLLVSCSRNPMPVHDDAPPIDPPSPSEPAQAARDKAEQAQAQGRASEAFEARVEIDAQPGGKKFQGVWLVRGDGQRWVIAYRPLEIWRPFEGKQVKVEGDRYEPFGQAIGAQHFRVDRMTIDPQSMTSLVRVEPERLLTGRFIEETTPEGSKLAGEVIQIFEAEGVRYLLANAPPDKPALGVEVRVKAREVELSPFSAHLGGRTLWILDASPAP